MKRSLKIFLVIAAIACVALLVVLSRDPKDVFECEEVQYSDITSTLTVSGKISALNEIEVKPRIEAYVSSIHVKCGDRVSKGQVLMTLEAIPDLALLESADTEVELQKIALRQAELDFQRAATLIEGNSISQKEYEAAINNLSAAKEQMKLANNKRMIVANGGSKNNDASKVLSPVDGIVSEVIVHEGEAVNAISYASPGTPLCRIADGGPLVFKGDVDEVDIASITVGMPAVLTLGALPSQTIQATVTEIESFGHAKNGYTQFEVTASISDTPQDVVLRSGYSANADITIETANHVLSIPEGCIMFDDNLNPYVIRLVSDRKGSQQKFEEIPVTIGINDKQNVQILSGLAEHDMVKSKKIGAK